MFKQKSVTHSDHALSHRVLLNSDATQTQIAHMVVGVHMLMDGSQSSVHSGRIIAGGPGAVNQLTK
jgi:hypothetical protein